MKSLRPMGCIPFFFFFLLQRLASLFPPVAEHGLRSSHASILSEAAAVLPGGLRGAGDPEDICCPLHMWIGGEGVCVKSQEAARNSFRFLTVAGEKCQTLRVPNSSFSLSTVSVLGQDESKRSNSLLECGIIQGDTFQKLWLRLSIHKSKQRRPMQPPFTYLTAYTHRFLSIKVVCQDLERKKKWPQRNTST